MGDILYSLYYATRYAHGEPFNYILQTDVRDLFDPSHRPCLMSHKEAEFLKPLLEAQPYINDVLISDSLRYAGDVYVLDMFRHDMRRVIGREIRTWYYERNRVPQGEFERAVLTVDPPPEKLDMIAVCFTPRYRQRFDLFPLKKYRDQIIFVGLPEEHDAFCRDWFNVYHYPVYDAFDLLELVTSCRGFVGNVSGTFAIMECAKVPRILCLEPRGGNVRPCGGFCREASTTDQLEIYLNQLMEETKHA
jgi:hypothetical protein